MTLLVALVLLAVVVVGTSSRSSSGQTAASSRKVLQRENAAGVHPELQGLLDAWEEQGGHVALIPSSPWGGLRTSEADQAGYAAGGMSGASTLAQTPHGRGGALDVWPEDFAAYVNGTWDAVPAYIKLQFEMFGTFAEARGFLWGGRWSSARFPNGDQPHIEMRDWRSLPFPPPAGGYS